MKTLVVAALMGFSLLASSFENQTGSPLGSKPSYVSTFVLGQIQEGETNQFHVNSLSNVLIRGNERTFDTFVQIVPIPGRHSFEVVISDKNGTTISRMNHGDVDVTKIDHVHALLSKWTVDVNVKGYVSFTVVDTFMGKRYNVASFKILVE